MVLKDKLLYRRHKDANGNNVYKLLCQRRVKQIFYRNIMHLQEGIWVKPRHWVNSKSGCMGQVMGRLLDYGAGIAQIMRREISYPETTSTPAECGGWISAEHCRTLPTGGGGGGEIVEMHMCW